MQPPADVTEEAPEGDVANTDLVEERSEGIDTSSGVDADSCGGKKSAEEASAGCAMESELTLESASAEPPSELPFQVQITYTDLDGAEAMRVLTQTQPVTRDRQRAETSTSPNAFCAVKIFAFLVRFLKNWDECLETV